MDTALATNGSLFRSGSFLGRGSINASESLLGHGSINASESLFLPYGSRFWPGRPLDGGSRLVWFASVKWIAVSH